MITKQKKGPRGPFLSALLQRIAVASQDLPVHRALQQRPDRLIKPLQLLWRGGATTQHQVDWGLLDVEQGSVDRGDPGQIELLQSHGVHDNPWIR